MAVFEADLSKYKTISILGECFEGMAKVYLAKHCPSNIMVAIKKYDMDRIKEDAPLVESEIILTRQLQHPNIVSYYVAFVDGPEVCVVSPLMAFGSCQDLLTRHFNEGLPENAIIIIIRDLLEALDYIHKKGYIHRAVRASHILISGDGRACLSGLRYACPLVVNGKWQKAIHSFPSSTARNLNWLSPEVLEQNLRGYNEKSDIYSVGMVTCELANGTEPFASMATTLMLVDKVRGCAPQLLDCSTVPRPESLECSGDVCEISSNIANRKFSEYLHELAALCLFKEPYDRPSAERLLTHPIFKSTKKSLPLQDLLKPALPYNDRVAYNTDELADLETINRLSQMEINSCEWDF